MSKCIRRLGRIPLIGLALMTLCSPGRPLAADPLRADELAPANQLFQQQRWAEARSAYDAVATKSADLTADPGWRAVKGALACSLQLGEWNDAWSRVRAFQTTKALPATPELTESYRRTERDAAAYFQAKARHPELVREMLLQLTDFLAAYPAQATRKRQEELTGARLQADRTLLQVLVGDDFDTKHHWGNESFDWWWHDPSRAEPDEDPEKPWAYWYRQSGIPAATDGRPTFLAAPASYASTLGRGQKILFLLHEIDQVDATPEKNHAARALLQKALIARKLYGPATDPAWINAEFYYEFAGRPSFNQDESGARIKPFWELADNEARTIVGGRLRVIALPPEESPLALLGAVERKYPKSDAVPEAIYLRGAYYQSRQQFGKAEEAYQALLKAHPGHARAADAQKQLKHLHQGGVLLGRTGVYPAGEKPRLWFACRAADKVTFTARKLDMAALIHDASSKGDEPYLLRYLNLNYFGGVHMRGFGRGDDRLTKYVGEKAAEWTETVKKTERVVSLTTSAPLSEVGAYAIEARLPGGDEPSTAVVVLTDIALVFKKLPEKSLVYVADARTGRPLADQQVRFFVEKERAWSSTTLKSNKDGVIEEKFKAGHYDVVALAVSRSGGIAVGDLRDRGVEDDAAQKVEYLITDRPVYRPGSTVHFRLWVREMIGRAYQAPKAGQVIRLELHNPQGHAIKSFELRTDAFGGASGDYELGPEAALGDYSLQVTSTGERYHDYAGSFRVEAYKKPEFEVTVKPPAKPARLGSEATVRIEARYLFGGPVAGGHVRYVIRREDYQAAGATPKEFDWLYGTGYGQYGYNYPWIGGGGAPAGNGGDFDSDRWGRYRYWSRDERGELVGQGETELKADGAAEIHLNTSVLCQGLNDRDHQFRIEAEVRDQSRRTIKGSGRVLVTRQEIAAFVEVDRGWYGPNSEAVVESLVRSASGDGVSVSGQLRLYRITYSGRGNDASSDDRQARQELVRTWDARTDARGRCTTKIQLPREGQYRVELLVRDSTSADVTASAVVWVHGPGFEGTAYRCGDLEIIPDRRSYKVGDTAHLLIHTAQPNARVLWSDDIGEYSLRSYRFLDVPAHVLVVDLPIEAKHVPNFFVEATLVAKGQVRAETCELYVPPMSDLLTVKIAADKDTYRPGAAGKIKVAVTDGAGRPVAGQLTLTTYDKAVTYIQEETNPKPSALIARKKVEHQAEVETSIGPGLFSATGGFLCPEFEFYDGGLQPIGGMGGAPPQGGDPAPDIQERVALRLAPPHANSVTRAATRGAGEDSLENRPALEPEIRANFADTALWRPAIELGPDGTAETTITFPQSLTTWRLRAYALTAATQVGDDTLHVTTDKNLLVRLQTPRFLVEEDDATLSANVHNYLKTDQEVAAVLLIPAALLKHRDVSGKDAAGNVHLPAKATVPAGGEHRFDWPVHALKEGAARITVKALAEGESDAMQLTVPILPRGAAQAVARTGAYRRGADGRHTVTLTAPEPIDPQKTRLEVALSAGPAGVMLDALPFLAGYPYGCTEQTMSRYYPSISAVETLKKLGINLETVARNRRANRPQGWEDRLAHGPSAVFDSAELERMAQAGLERLYSFQHRDGGWGWWADDTSSFYMTAYVLMGLDVAMQAGQPVRTEVVESGFNYLYWMLEVQRHERSEKAGPDHRHTQALMTYVLCKATPPKGKRFTTFDDRDKLAAQRRELLDSLQSELADLTPYDCALLALALHHNKDAVKAREVLRALLNRTRRDDAAGTAWVPTAAADWWRAWNSDIETNAWVLRAVVAIDPDNPLAAGLAQWLCDNRRGGQQWRSTRDTAAAVVALGDYVATVKAAIDDCRITIHLDGNPVKEVAITRANFLTLDSRFVQEGPSIAPGKHDITLTKSGRGEVFYSCRLSYFSKSNCIEAESKGLSIDRRYFRLVEGSKRLPLADRDRVAVGETVEVVLTINAEHDYDYLAFVDPKPAGCEPLQVQSGWRWLGQTWAVVELRDEQQLFFVHYLGAGLHQLRYRLRAETPGAFHVLPAAGFAMYAPEIRANSAEQRMRIGD